MATIQGVYVALFGRPADPAGLAYFNGLTKNGADLSAIGNLAGQPEYLERFTGMTNAQIINSIYKSLFDRDADPAGLGYFVNAMANGTLNINNIAIAILDGAQNADKALISNKLAAAEAFTSRVDLPTEISAYVGMRASGIASKMLAEIKPDVSTIPDNAKIDGVIQEIVGLSAGGTAGGSSAAAPLEEAVPGGATTNTSADSGSSAGGNGQGNTPSASGPEVGSGVTLNGTTMDITGSAVTILKDGTNLSTVTALTANVNNGLKIEQDLPSLTSAVINGQADSSTYAAKFGKIGDTGTKSVKIDASKATGLIDIASIEGSTINIIGSETSNNNVGKFEILPSERLGIFSNAEALNVKIQGGAGQDTYNIYGTVNNKTINVTGDMGGNVPNGLDALYIAGHEASEFGLKIDVSGIENAELVTMIGTKNNDILTGGSARDVLMGMAGDDVITSGAGIFVIDGGEGNDVLKLDLKANVVDEADVSKISKIVNVETVKLVNNKDDKTLLEFSAKNITGALSYELTGSLKLTDVQNSTAAVTIDGSESGTWAATYADQNTAALDVVLDRDNKKLTIQNDSTSPLSITKLDRLDMTVDIKVSTPLVVGQIDTNWVYGGSLTLDNSGKSTVNITSGINGSASSIRDMTFSNSKNVEIVSKNVLTAGTIKASSADVITINSDIQAGVNSVSSNMLSINAESATTLNIYGFETSIMSDSNLSSVKTLVTDVEGLFVDADLSSIETITFKSTKPDDKATGTLGKLGGKNDNQSITIDAEAKVGNLAISQIVASNVVIKGSKTGDVNVVPIFTDANKDGILNENDTYGQGGISSNDTRLTVDVTGGIGKDEYRIVGTDNNQSIVIKGDLGGGTNTVQIDGKDTIKNALTIDASELKNAKVTISGTKNADTIKGSSGDDVITGSNGDTLTGGDGKDHFKVVMFKTATRDAFTLTITDLKDGDKLTFDSLKGVEFGIPTAPHGRDSIKTYGNAFDEAKNYFETTNGERSVSIRAGDDAYVFIEGSDGMSVGSAVHLVGVMQSEMINTPL